jgi:hypothetical protein
MVDATFIFKLSKRVELSVESLTVHTSTKSILAAYLALFLRISCGLITIVNNIIGNLMTPLLGGV